MLWTFTLRRSHLSIRHVVFAMGGSAPLRGVSSSAWCVKRGPAAQSLYTPRLGVLRTRPIFVSILSAPGPLLIHHAVPDTPRSGADPSMANTVWCIHRWPPSKLQLMLSSSQTGRVDDMISRYGKVRNIGAPRYRTHTKHYKVTNNCARPMFSATAKPRPKTWDLQF